MMYGEPAFLTLAVACAGSRSRQGRSRAQRDCSIGGGAQARNHAALKSARWPLIIGFEITPCRMESFASTPAGDINCERHGNVLDRVCLHPEWRAYRNAPSQNIGRTSFER